MGSNVQTPSHEGLRAWFELLRTSRNGPMPKYQVHGSIHCSYPECKNLTAGVLRTTSWVERQRDGTNYLCAFRHSDLCPWQKQVYRDYRDSRNSFTSQPLERAYVYWARFEHKFNHI